MTTDSVESHALTMTDPTPVQVALIRASSPLIRASSSQSKGWATRRLRGAQAGNRNAARHYAYANLSITGEIAERCDYLLSVAPWLDPLRDGPLLHRTAALMVRLAKIDLYLDAIDWSTSPNVQALKSHAARMEGQIARNLSELGLSPKAGASLGIAHMDARQRAAKLAEQDFAVLRQVER